MSRLFVHASLGLTAIGCLLLVGCVSVGPRTIRSASFDYNEAIARSWNEQLLLNLVRLRYRDSPYFLRVTSVTTQYVLEASASAGKTFVGGSDSDPSDLGVGIDYTERPTVTYLPVQGEEFTRQLLLPVSLDSLFLLTQSGWSAEQVLRCCVERVGDLRNAAALGGTPSESIDDFHRVGELLQWFRQGNRLDVAIVSRGDRSVLQLTVPPAAAATPESSELRRLLGLEEDGESFTLVPLFATREDGEVGMLPRSLLAIMFFLSQGVEVPQRDLEQGRVEEAGGPATLDGLFSVRVSSDRPVDAFARVRYRDSWFFIADDDFEAKETFGLLSYLLALQSGGKASLAPLQTLSLGQ